MESRRLAALFVVICLGLSSECSQAKEWPAREKDEEPSGSRELRTPLGDYYVSNNSTDNVDIAVDASLKGHAVMVNRLSPRSGSPLETQSPMNHTASEAVEISALQSDQDDPVRRGKILLQSVGAVLTANTSKAYVTALDVSTTSTHTYVAEIPSGYSIPSFISHYTSSVVSPVGSMGPPSVGHYIVIDAGAPAGTYQFVVEYSFWDGLSYVGLDWISFTVTIETYALIVDQAAIDFGTVYTGATGSSSFTLTNRVERDLAVSIGTSSPGVSIGAADDLFTLPAFGSKTVSVYFQPAVPGNYNGSVGIGFSDGPLQMSGGGTVTTAGVGAEPPQPDIQVSPASLDFGEVAVGTTKSIELQISNAGNADLVISSSASSNPQFSFSVSSGTLSPGYHTTDYFVVFTPVAPRGAQSATLTIASNDPDQPSTVISASGSVGNSSPTLSGIGNQSVAEGAALSLTLSGSDPDGDGLTYSVSGNPSGSSLSGNLFSWTPNNDQAGDYQITFTASDGNGGEASETATVTVSDVNRPPILSGIGNQAVAEGFALSLTLSGSDPDGGGLTYSVSGNPSGSSLAGDLFSWTPDNDQAGSYTVTFTVSDGSGGETSETITITVSDANQSPTLTGIGSQSVAEGAALSLTLTGSDPDGDALTYSVSGNPAGSSLSGNGFSWTPTNDQAGSYQVTFAVSDGRGGEASETVTITVADANRSPILSGIGDQTTSEGVAFSLTLSGSDPDGDALTYSVSGNPSGSSLSGNVFSWTPNNEQAGDYQVTFTVGDGSGGETTETVTITVADANRPPTLSGIGDQNVSEGSALSLTLVGSDADGDGLTYSVSGNPSGSSLSGAAFSWTPNNDQAGSYQITFTVSDGSGGEAAETITVTVTDANRVPTLSSIGSQTVQEGTALSLTLSGSDADGTPLSFSVSGNPSGSSLSGNVFSWTPNNDQAGSYQVTFTVSDGSGGEAAETITIAVTDANRLPVLSAVGNQSISEGSALSLTLSASDADGDALSYSVSGNPSGSSLSGSVFSWTPSSDQAGTYQVTFAVNDGKGGDASEIVTITVSDTNSSPSLAGLGSQSVAEGSALSLTLTASDPDADALTYSVSGNPSGSSLLGNVFSWTPGFDQAGTYQVTFTVTDGKGGDASETITVTVSDANQLPVLHGIGNQTVSEGSALSLTLSGSDPDGDVLTYAVSGNPTGSSLAGNVFSWTPGPDQAGNHSLVFTASDGRGGDTSETIVISVGDVNRPPTLSGIGDQNVSEGFALSLTLSASDPDGDGLSYSVSGNPTGSSLEGNVFGWTPGDDQAGSYTVTFTVSDGSGGEASETITIAVSDVNRSPTLSGIGNQSASEGSALSLTLSGSDPDGDALTYSVAGNPTGSSLSTNVFGWTPGFDQAGSYQVTFTVTDGKGGDATETVTITVSDSNRSPILSGIGNQSVTEGSALSLTLSGSDPDGDALTFSVSSNPSGSSLSGNVFNWTPGSDQAGSHSLTLAVSDGRGGDASETIVISVGDVNRPPVLAVIGNQSVSEGSALNLTLSGSDPDGDALTYSASGNPAGSALADNVFSWTPNHDQAGSYEVAFSASDGQGGTVSETITIAVADANRSPTLAYVGDQSASEGGTLTLVLAGSDADGDELSYTMSDSPSGSSLAGNVFSWTPGINQAGSYQVTFTVSDSKGGEATATTTITIADVNQPPTLAEISNRSVSEGEAVTFTLWATDPDWETLTFTVSGNPLGSSLTGDVFNWTPSNDQAGSYAVTFTVSDGRGGQASQTTVISVGDVNHPPTLSSIGDQSVSEGSALALTLSGMDPDGNAITYSVSGNPSGSSLSNNQFSWTPNSNQAGNYTVTFTVSDGSGGEAKETITITVADANQSPTLSSIGNQSVSEGSALTLTLSGSDPDGDALTYSVSGNPSGSSLSNNQFSWTPDNNQAGNYTVTFTVSDGRGGQATQTIVISVGDVNHPPTLSGIGNQSVSEGSILTLTLTGNDPDGDAIAYSASGDPSGSSLVGNVFNWTPNNDQAGSYQVSFTASDGKGGEASEAITITVVDVNRSPTLSGIGNQSVTEGSDLSLTLSGSDPDGDTLAYSVSGNPSGSSLAGNRFSWTPDDGQASSYQATFTVGDGKGGVASETITIVVDDLVLASHLEMPIASVDFEVVAVGQPSRERRLPLRNTGTGPLEIYDLAISDPAFRVAQHDSLPLLVAPGMTRFLVLVFEPIEEGVVRGDLTIFTLDDQLPEVVVRLRGEGENLGIFDPVLVSETVVFGPPDEAGFERAVLIIHNRGALDGQVQVVADDAAISTGEAIYEVSAGGSVSIDLLLDAGAASGGSGQLVIEPIPSVEGLLLVDWAAVDRLELLDADPADGATSVPVQSDLILYFSEALQLRGSVPALDVRLRPQALSGPLEDNARLSSSGRVVTLPAQLAENTTYELTLYSAEGRSGAVLPRLVRWRFSTGATPIVGGAITGQVYVGSRLATVGRVYLADQDQQVVGEQDIQKEGRYSFENVTPGAYQVFVQEPSSQVSSAFDVDGDGRADNVEVGSDQQIAGIDLRLPLDAFSPTDGEVTTGTRVSLDLNGTLGDQSQETQVVAGGETVTLCLYVNGAADLTGFAAQLSYDAEQIETVRVRERLGDEENVLHMEGGTPLFLQHTTDEGNGYTGALLGPTSATSVSGNGLLAVWTLRVAENAQMPIEVQLESVTCRTLSGAQEIISGQSVVLEAHGPGGDISPVVCDVDPDTGNQDLGECTVRKGDEVEIQLFYTAEEPITGFGLQLEFDSRVVDIPAAGFSASESESIPLVRSLSSGQVEIGAVKLSGVWSQPLLGTVTVVVPGRLAEDSEIVLSEVTLRFLDRPEVRLSVNEHILLKADASVAGDFNSDGEVDFSDFFLFADAFGQTDPDPLYDLNSDGEVDFSDFFLFADFFSRPQQAKLIKLAELHLGLPPRTYIETNYPNPFNSRTVLRYRVGRPTRLHLTIYDMNGQLVSTLLDENCQAGVHQLSWSAVDMDGRPLSAGVYLARLQTGAGSVHTRKLLHVK